MLYIERNMMVFLFFGCCVAGHAVMYVTPVFHLIYEYLLSVHDVCAMCMNGGFHSLARFEDEG